MEINQLTRKIIGAAIEVHKILGPGLLESAYQQCLAHELILRGILFEREKIIPIVYKGFLVEGSFRVDFLVEDQVILEIKSIESLLPIHDAQLLTYLKLTGCKIGLLINFNVPLLKNGISRKILTNKQQGLKTKDTL